MAQRCGKCIAISMFSHLCLSQNVPGSLWEITVLYVREQSRGPWLQCSVGFPALAAEPTQLQPLLSLISKLPELTRRLCPFSSVPDLQETSV